MSYLLLHFNYLFVNICAQIRIKDEIYERNSIGGFFIRDRCFENC